MAQLVPMSELVREHNYELGADVPSLLGDTAYGSGGEKIGKVVDALAEDGGKLRYLVVEVGNWFTSKHVVIPVGQARFDDQGDAVYFDDLTKEQAKAMTEYMPGQDYPADRQLSDERVLRGNDAVDAVINPDEVKTGQYNYRDDLAEDTTYKTPGRLQLLEERLMVNKEKYQAGSVTVGKHVETRQENVDVDLSRDEVVIERRPVTDARPVEGNVTLGAGSETLRVDLEAERANVQKQAFVTEEVNVGKRTETERQTFSETVGKEVLDVNKTGDVEVSDSSESTASRDPNSGR